MIETKKHLTSPTLKSVSIIAAIDAGKKLRKSRESLLSVTYQDRSDIKLKADQSSEETIRRHLSTTGIPIIGEESGGDENLLKQSKEPYWIVDPLDGTYNYFRGQDHCCVSIALCIGTKALWGVVHLLSNQKTYTGGIDETFAVNGKKTYPQWVHQKNQACLMTGFPAGMATSKKSLERITTEINQFKKVRMIGSAAIAMAMVAEGQADCYKEYSVKLWDIAAGLALVESAGGNIQLVPSLETPYSFDVVASGL